MSNIYTPPTADTQVAMIQGLVPNDGGDKPWAARNIIAYAIILLFAFEVAAPYFFDMPGAQNSQAVNLILTSSKTVETVLVLVLGFYFGTTISSAKKDETIRQQAMAAPLALPAPDPSQTLVTPSTTAEVTIKEPSVEPDPDAGRGADPTAVPAQPAGVQPGDGGPAE